MTIRGAIRDRPVAVLYGLIVVSLAGLLPLPPLLQDQSYHQFADQRELFGIPNFWNVVSNLPFVAVGAAGLLRFRRDATSTVLFTGIFLTGFGSSYYHLNPNDVTLFWDRLPMTLCFAAILAAVVEERVDARAGAMLLRPLLAIGIFSLLLWRWTDDLRLYAWAQFFPDRPWLTGTTQAACNREQNRRSSHFIRRRAGPRRNPRVSLSPNAWRTATIAVEIGGSSRVIRWFLILDRMIVIQRFFGTNPPVIGLCHSMWAKRIPTSSMVKVVP